MSQYFSIHPDNPQIRLIKQTVSIIQNGGVIVYPTDSCYAIGCHLDDKTALDRISRIRQVNNEHNYTLLCRDLSEISTYAKVDNVAFRFMKTLTPGAFTFILKASHDVPRRLQNPKRKTIGLRIPDHAIAQAILTELNEALLTSTLIMPGKTVPEIDPEEIRELLEKHVDLIIDGGHCGVEPTTVIDFTGDSPEIVRQGKGQVDIT